jgi:hypothetical protein
MEAYDYVTTTRLSGLDGLVWDAGDFDDSTLHPALPSFPDHRPRITGLDSCRMPLLNMYGAYAQGSETSNDVRSSPSWPARHSPVLCSSVLALRTPDRLYLTPRHL